MNRRFLFTIVLLALGGSLLARWMFSCWLLTGRMLARWMFLC